MFSKSSLSRWIPLMALLAVFLLYCLTAFRAIPWWDAPENTLAAYTLGVVNPPGALLLTIIGWIVTRFPGPPDFILSLTAGAIGVFTIGLVFFSVKTVLNGNPRFTPGNPSENTIVTVALALGVILLGGLSTLWQFSTKFTPYILTACFTALILWGLLHWKDHLDEPIHLRWLFLVGLLVGLDFSVHRTNLLLVPGILFWVLVFRPKLLINPKVWAAMIVGGITGLLFHLLLIPMATADPFLNFTDPSTLSRFWDYVSLQQYGGGFLVDLFPRTAPFWSYQIMDYLQTFANNFLFIDSPLGVAGVLPGILGIFGLGMLFRRHWKTALGTVGLFVCMSLVAVLYFNLPENYIRPISRHYLPSFVLFGFWILCVIGFLGQEIHHRSSSFFPVIGAGLVIVIGVAGVLLRNYPERDMSQHRFAEDFARNMLMSLPDDAILFTNGDADTFPLWYLQEVEGYRQDVTVCNIYLLNTRWFLKQLVSRDTEFPLNMTSEEIDNLGLIPWADSTLVVRGDPHPKKYGLPKLSVMPDSITLSVPPSGGGEHLFIHDQIVLRILRQNRWRRPVYLSIGIGPSLSYLEPFLRLEGVVRRLIPGESPEVDTAILKKNLVTRYHYHGYNNPDVPIDAMTNWAALNYYNLWLALVSSKQRDGETGDAFSILETLESTIPAERVEMPEAVSSRVDSLRRQLAS